MRDLLICSYSWPHLSHIITGTISDMSDSNKRQSNLVRQVSNVYVTFLVLIPSLKLIYCGGYMVVSVVICGARC